MTKKPGNQGDFASTWQRETRLAWRPMLPDFLAIAACPLSALFDPSTTVQSQSRARPFHAYAALRLVLEGGFEPEKVHPRPPFSCRIGRNGIAHLHYTPELANFKEATVVGEYTEKRADVAVVSPGIGPQLVISFRTTGGAYRNISNRWEELLGDIGNLRGRYDWAAAGYWHVIKATPKSRASNPDDAAFFDDGLPLAAIQSFHDQLVRLADPRRLHGSDRTYDAIALLSVSQALTGGFSESGFPATDSLVSFYGFFPRLYQKYDDQFSFSRREARRRWRLSDDLTSVLSGLPAYPPFLAYSPRTL